MGAGEFTGQRASTLHGSHSLRPFPVPKPDWCFLSSPKPTDKHKESGPLYIVHHEHGDLRAFFCTKVKAVGGKAATTKSRGFETHRKLFNLKSTSVFPGLAPVVQRLSILFPHQCDTSLLVVDFGSGNESSWPAHRW
ncbi:hypothetical protein ElyMa_005844900 [Elysia marginata]|uniref:Uncharacterized protein n=1 Tax=Elysia marginata TaxID=1093978 RepID=A0AAV4FY45_9GAST|nr:hypothetical protein ElyMa_005844900 [Elysia marginata]